MGSADADVVRAAGHTQSDGAVIGAVGADPVVGVGAGPGFALGRAW